MHEALVSEDPTNRSIEELVERAIEASKLRPRTLITIAGIPGSGKSTAAAEVGARLNAAGVLTAVVGMDGFHYPRSELVKRIGPERAQKYRGAPYTFDAEGVAELAHELAKNTTTDIVFPTFDHAVKDPVAGGGVVPKDTRIVILEGLYVQLDEEHWRRVGEFAHDTWFVYVDEPTARERLARRHLRSGIVSTLSEGYDRADTNDLVNGRYIMKHSRPAKVRYNTAGY